MRKSISSSEINRPLDGELLNRTESFDNLCADCLYLKERKKKTNPPVEIGSCFERQKADFRYKMRI